MNDGLGEAGGVVLDADGLFGLVEGEMADSVDLANAAEGHHGGLCRRSAVAIHYVKLRHGFDFTSEACGRGSGAEAVEVVDDFGAGPVLGGDELAAEDAIAVDGVGFGDLRGAVEGVDAGVGVADGEEVDVIALEEGAVGIVVLVHADGDDGDAGHLVLEGEQAGELVDAGSAPAGPEVDEDDVAAEFGEVDGVCAVGDGELRGGFADVLGVVAAVAAGDQECGSESDGEQVCAAKGHWFL